MVTIADIRAAARYGGWSEVAAERVLRMASVLGPIASHPDTRDVLALKGGTALNAIDHDMPRLSVDLAFDFVGDVDRASMLAARPVIAAAITAIAARSGMSCRLAADAHGGTTWVLTFRGITGSGVIEIDVNWLRRSPIAVPRRVDRTILDVVELHQVLVAAPAELAAGKLLALLDRCRARDVWDVALLATSDMLGDPDLPLSFVVQLAGARRAWRDLVGTDVAVDMRDAERMLLPLLRRSEQPRDIASWAAELTDRAAAAVMPFRTIEPAARSFIDAIADEGIIDPGLLNLTPDDARFGAIDRSPALLWKTSRVQAAREDDQPG